MDEKTLEKVTETAAYVESSTMEFEGFDLEFNGETKGISSEYCHIAPRSEHGKVHLGKISGSFEGFISKEGWSEMIRAAVEITIAELKAAPELIKPIFCLMADCIRAILEEKRQNRELKKLELELELQKFKAQNRNESKAKAK